jgi:lipoate---protein ligase
MHLLDLTLPTLAENLALDEALLLDAEAGGPALLRFWEWTRFAVVLGPGGKAADDVHENACREDAIPIHKRSSGGGTVLLGPGCLLYSLILPYQRHPDLQSLRPSYRHILKEMTTALTDLLPGITQDGISDLVHGHCKFSGNAQQRKRANLLHHGTLLYAFSLEKISRYLKIPPRQPDYRKGREHQAFLLNLPTNAAELKKRLSHHWQAFELMTDWPQEKVRALVAEKYGPDPEA